MQTKWKNTKTKGGRIKIGWDIRVRQCRTEGGVLCVCVRKRRAYDYRMYANHQITAPTENWLLANATRYSLLLFSRHRAFTWFNFSTLCHCTTCAFAFFCFVHPVVFFCVCPLFICVCMVVVFVCMCVCVQVCFPFALVGCHFCLFPSPLWERGLLFSSSIYAHYCDTIIETVFLFCCVFPKHPCYLPFSSLCYLR